MTELIVGIVAVSVFVVGLVIFPAMRVSSECSRAEEEELLRKKEEDII